MFRVRLWRAWQLSIAAAILFLSPLSSHAQSAAGIVGVVVDDSGSTLPGVTVEVSSPALIERTKSTVTSADGRYQVVDLRPGEYTVSFTLEGFQSVRRTGITLNTGFTASVDARLPIGQLQDEVTVVGGAPVIDTRSGTSERPLHQELLEGIPVGRVPNVAVSVVPGAVTARPDIGGSETGQTAGVSIHGSQTRDLIWNTDGLNMTSNTGSGGVSGQYPNQSAIQEIVVQTRALPAEIGAGGVSVNMISKDGGSTFRGTLFGTYTNNSLQSANVSSDQRDRGLRAPSAMDVFYDLNGGIGGPIARDSLWFFASARRFRVDRFEANTFNPDGSQALDENLIWNTSGKLTWQINSANRLTSFVDYNYKIREHRREIASTYQFVSPEASYNSPLWGPLANVKLTSTLSPTLLLDAGFSWYYVPWSLDYQPDLAADAFARNDISLSTLTGAPPPSMVRANQERRTASAILSWLPRFRGEHQIRTGVQFEHAPYGQTFDSLGHGDFIARYRNGVPDSVQVYNTPVQTNLQQYDLGVFVQDSWAVSRRLTLNLGLRYERHTGGLGAQSAGAGQFVPERSFPAQGNLVVWNTLVPRLAATYDLSGQGRTVLKVSASQYTQRQGSALINQFSPMRQNTEVRSWVDANADLVPQLNEIGPSLGGLDRGATVRIDPELTRPTQWEYAATVEHQLADDFAVALSYFHRRYSNLTAVVNTALTFDDYSPLTITNPLDGTPFTIYNQNAGTIGRVDNVLTNVPNLEQTYHGVEATVNRRFKDGLTLFGGITLGHNRSTSPSAVGGNPNGYINADGYDLLDSPLILNFSGIYELPWQVNLSGHLGYFTGQPLRRLYTVTRTIAPTLRQVSQEVALLPAGDERKPNQTLLDLRLGRSFRLGRGINVEPLVEVYNLLNENASVTEVEQVGAALGRVSRNLDGRLVRLGFKVAF
jgi:outer membrane receptor protein involved in Fe transport